MPSWLLVLLCLRLSHTSVHLYLCLAHSLPVDPMKRGFHSSMLKHTSSGPLSRATSWPQHEDIVCYHFTISSQKTQPLVAQLSSDPTAKRVFQALHISCSPSSHDICVKPDSAARRITPSPRCLLECVTGCGSVEKEMEQRSCTEDRIQHLLERCLCDLGVDTPDKQLWNAGLCMNRWCLEELVKRDPHNFLILLQNIVGKTKEVLERCQYELVVPLSLLFSSTLLKAPYVAPDWDVLWEAYLLFHSFLSWPEPCSSASKRLLRVMQQELRAPGISFQRLVRAEQGLSTEIHRSKIMTVLLVSPEEDVPPEVQLVSEQLSSSQASDRDVLTTLIQHSFQAGLGTKYDLQELHTALQTKRTEELEQLLQEVTENMEMAASAADSSSARQRLLNNMERIREGLAPPAPAPGCTHTGSVETFALPFPKCHTCSWENDNFDFLNEILTSESDVDSTTDCFLKAGLDEDYKYDTSVDEEEEEEGSKVDQDFPNHRISTTSSSSRDSMFSSHSLSSSWSVPSASSGVESDFSEDPGLEDPEEGQDSQPKPRKKPKKKSKSLLGMERISMLFKNPRSPSTCRRVQSMGYHSDLTKDVQRSGSRLKLSRSLSRQASIFTSDPLSPQKQVCVRRRPILSCDGAEGPTLVRVVVFGGDREAGPAGQGVQRPAAERTQVSPTHQEVQTAVLLCPDQEEKLAEPRRKHADRGPDRKFNQSCRVRGV
ncbi:unnamed protein product [Pleuronectes platessa]|uniref:Phosphoinositide 3-kinase regulatory subunit 5 n=1 Tax=Pleuronectes platessa TaxID=8262 RepID=A0A9N7UL15_PLEPL|nr:unnamed protein product [Pleuronectes platessa]